MRQRRAGREPAEDVKRRFVADGKAAGFEKGTARMFLQGDGRVVYVRLLRPPHGFVEVTGFVGIDGSFCGCVRIAATIGADDHITFHAMSMHGREAVPLERIKEELELVAQEMSEIKSAIEFGDRSPQRFGSHVRWELI